MVLLHPLVHTDLSPLESRASWYSYMLQQEGEKPLRSAWSPADSNKLDLNAYH